MEIYVGDDLFCHRRIAFHGMIFYEKAVFVDHLAGECVHIGQGTHLIDQDRELGGKVVDIQRVYTACFDSFPAESVQNDGELHL